MANKNVKKIVITGAPASGKTEFMFRLKNNKKFAEFHFFDELARELLAENYSIREKPAEFHLEIYNRQILREKAIGEKPFITDRGTLDGLSFYSKTLNNVNTSVADEFKRYTDVIQLGTAATLGEAFYIQDDIRTESLDQCLHLQNELKLIWSPHPSYHFIEPEVDFDSKYDKFLKTILELISIL